MNVSRNRREFLADVGRGMLVTTLGLEVAGGLGFAPATVAEEVENTLSFGSLEPLVRLMQESSADVLLPRLVDRLRNGTELRQMVAAAALANARTFGGEDYIGYHTVMALAPAYHMALESPVELQALPVLKVLYRNTVQIQKMGGRSHEVLHAVAAGAPSAETLECNAGGERLREVVRRKDMDGAEQIFATIARHSAEDALNSVLFAVQDDTEVHRVVLPYRAWDLVGIIGSEHAHTLLRQSVRYCVRAETGGRSTAAGDSRALVPRLFDEYGLPDRAKGDRQADDTWVDGLGKTIFESNPSQAAGAVAAALAEGMSPDAIGEAIALAANQLVLRDQGRRPQEESPGKPVGSVHGDSIGVHACDSANAWRNLARASNTRNRCASLILGAYQVAYDRTARGGDFLHWQPLPIARHANDVASKEPEALLREADEAIRGNLQARASAIIHRYGELGHPERPAFDLLRRYAVSEDGSLHAEKFYRTASEEFAAARSAFKWRYLVALARVTASEYGRPAPGMAEARSLLGLA